MTEARYPYVHVIVPVDDADVASGTLWELGALGVEERDATTLSKSGAAETTLLVASFEDEAAASEALSVLAEEYGDWKATLEFVVGEQWRDAWKAFFKPTRIGTHLIIRPAWEEFALSPGDVEVVLEPGRAFGTGTHETTRMVLGSLEGNVRKGEPLLDVGCGSGILAIAAIKLGASRAICIDVDPDAAEVTRENAQFNGVLAQVEASTTSVEDITDTFSLVLANIEARVLIPLAPAIAARVAPGGTLILSGILVGQEKDVQAAYPGFALRAAPVDGEWVSLTLQRA